MMEVERRGILSCTAILMLAEFFVGYGKTGQESLSVSAGPIFHCDLQHTGSSPYVGPQIDALEWRFKIDDVIGSSLAIVKEGIIYIDLADGQGSFYG